MNIKKHFCKKRGLLSKLSRSGKVLHDVADAQKDFDQYAFLGWLAPYVHQKQSHSSFKENEEVDNEEFSVDNGYDLEEDEDDDEEDLAAFDDSTKSDERECKTERFPNIKKRVCSKRTKKQEKETEQRKKHIKQTDLLGTEMKMMKNMSKILESKLERQSQFHDPSNQDDIFGKMVASELKNFPDHLKFQVKHEINTVLFKYCMQGMSPPPTPRAQVASPTFSMQTQLSNQPLQSSPGFPVGGVNSINN